MSALPHTEGDVQSKLLANLRARLALAGGFVLHELSDGTYVVCRWNLSRSLPSLEAVSRFLDQIGAR